MTPLTNKAQARVACPAWAAIFPFAILSESLMTKTSLTSSVRFALREAMSDVRAADSSSASESVSVPSIEPAAEEEELRRVVIAGWDGEGEEDGEGREVDERE